MKKHYAIKAKSRVFRYFDEGKRPSDITGEQLARQTLYQYYAEWRREHGIKGKDTGFALKPFVRNVSGVAQSLSQNIQQDDRHKSSTSGKTMDNSLERQNLDNFILDCITIIDALKHGRPGMISLPGSQTKKYLTDILRIKERDTGNLVFLTFDQYRDLFSKWMDIARRVKSREDFYRTSAAEGINYEAPGLQF